jgi:glutathionyl-hydroquinone reductase
MTHTDEQFDTLDEMKDDLREYFDKSLKPKKETIKNVDREILCYALERAYKAGFATAQSAKVEEMREMREALAELEHEQWVKWSNNLATVENISHERYARWKQLWKPYSHLSEEEKDQDRVWADKVIALLSPTPAEVTSE